MRMTRLSEIIVVLVGLWFFLPILGELRDYVLKQIGFGTSYHDPGELALMMLCVIVAGIVAIRQNSE